MALYPLTRVRGGGVRMGLAPLVAYPRFWELSGLVKAGEIPLEDQGFASSDLCFLSQFSESRARTH